MMLPEAILLPIKANSDHYLTTSVFELEGEPGIYRRMTKDKGGDNHIKAHYNDEIVHLVRWVEFDAQLKDLGYGMPVKAGGDDEQSVE